MRAKPSRALPTTGGVCVVGVGVIVESSRANCGLSKLPKA
jgi:hypothetical protein